MSRCKVAWLSWEYVRVAVCCWGAFPVDSLETGSVFAFVSSVPWLNVKSVGW